MFSKIEGNAEYCVKAALESFKFLPVFSVAKTILQHHGFPYLKIYFLLFFWLFVLFWEKVHGNSEAVSEFAGLLITLVFELLRFLPLELRQYKNDGIAERNLFVLKMPPFSLTYTVRQKGRQFQNKQISFGNRVVLIMSLL